MLERHGPSISSRVGAIIDCLFVAVVCVAWWVFWGSDSFHLDEIPLIAAPISIAGCAVAGRRLLLRSGALSSGLKLWGWHGVASLMVFLFWLLQELRADDSLAAFGKVVFLSGITLAVQTVLGAVAAYHLIRGRAVSAGDKAGSLICVAYVPAMAYWLLFIWQ